MPEKVRDVMSHDPVALAASTPLNEAAKQMRDHDIGDVLVTNDGRLCGIITDRDIVVRALAEERDPATTTLDDICTHQLVQLSPDDFLSDAVQLMREHDIRRLPVVEGDKAVGMISLGDLAIELDPDSALGDISAAEENN